MVVQLDYDTLVKSSKGELSSNDEEKLLKEIKLAYDENGLGILTVKGVPKYSDFRKNLLVLSQRVATLPEPKLSKLKDENSNWSFGWSHGVEILQDGTPDIMKGSFYANPNYNSPIKILQDQGLNVSKEEAEKYKIYSKSNIWPTNDIPELENCLFDLGGLITNVGVLVMKACDKYLAKLENNKPNQKLHKLIESSVCNKARLLHYFPPSKLGRDVSEADLEKWCGVHCDHSILTGICRAMYLTPEYKEVKNSDPEAGLYVISRNGTKTKIKVPEDEIGFQIGHTAQLISNNALIATPHYVRAPNPNLAVGGMKDVSRNTFAVFMQPFWNEKLYTELKPSDLVEGLKAKDFFSGMTFGEFSEALINHYHEPNAGQDEQTKAKL